MHFVWMFFKNKQEVYGNKPKKKTLSCKGLKEAGGNHKPFLFLFLFKFLFKHFPEFKSLVYLGREEGKFCEGKVMHTLGMVWTHPYQISHKE